MSQLNIEGLSEVAKLQVSSVEPAEVPKGQVLVIARTRATTDRATGKKKEIEAANRMRCVLIPELEVRIESKFVMFVLSALYDIAKDQLSALWEEHGDSMVEVDAAIWHVDALLGYAARKAETKKLSADSIVAWFATSELKKKLVAKYNEKQIAALLDDLKAIASPVIPWSEEKLLKRIALIGGSEDDATTDVGASMIRKMSNRAEAMKKDREALGSMDDIEV